MGKLGGGRQGTEQEGERKGKPFNLETGEREGKMETFTGFGVPLGISVCLEGKRGRRLCKFSQRLKREKRTTRHPQWKRTALKYLHK